MGGIVEWGSQLAKKNISRLFTCDLIQAWLATFGSDPVTIDDLLGSGATCYLLLRAAGVANPMFGRSRDEVSRMNTWFSHFSRNPIPTHDGLDNITLTPVGKAWSIRAVDVLLEDVAG